MQTSPSVQCPDEEVFATYLDRRMSAAERAQFEAHVAGCPSCYELLVESARGLEELPGSDAASVLEFRPDEGRCQASVWRRPWFVPVAAAAAALLAVAVYLLAAAD
jgi:anti-sigma factor RsiW